MLDAWTASPERFREDANAEHDARTGYRDRLVVELAQNAVDAGATRLLLSLRGSTLVVANDGTPLRPEGVVGLSTLRASGKRSSTSIGRYGVGFAAVLAVTDSPSIGSRHGVSASWSAARVREEIVGVPALVAEAERRGGQVPVLRLPYDSEVEVPDGFETAVVLPCEHPSEVRALLSSIDETLPLVLRGLAEVTVDVEGDRRVIRCELGADGAVLDGRRWLRASARGTRPVIGPEDDGRWEVDAWAPAAGALDLPQVLHAPTPTDEPLSLPVLLAVRGLELEPNRRRVVRGPASERLLAEAADVLAGLMIALDDPRPLVPVGLADGWVDAAVRAALLERLPGTPVLQGLPGSRCVVLEHGLERAAPLLDVEGLLDWPPSPELDVLGVRRLDTAAVLDLLGARSPMGWREVYDALQNAPDRDALGALPVPLVDGRVVTGPRGLLVADDLPPEVRDLPLRLVHPDAAHPLLERLGAVPATAAGLLDDDELRRAVEDDPGLSQAVLALVRRAGTAPPWVADTVLLPSSEGMLPAGDLLLPGGLLHRAGADLPLVELPDWLDAETACAAGVLDRPQLTDDPDVDGYDEWVASLDHEPTDPVLVRDLHLAEDPGVLLAGVLADRELRAALPGYLGWWLGAHGALGLPAAEYALDAPELYATPPDLPADVLAALGVRGIEDRIADPDDAADLLDRLGDADRVVDGRRAAALYRRCAAVHADDPPDPPLAVRALDGTAAPADRALVVDAPDLLPLASGRAVLVGDAAVADLLDLDLASELHGAPAADGVEAPQPLGFPGTYQRCTRVRQDGVDLPWRLHDGVLFATDEGLADGLAWLHGQWSRRHTIRALLTDPSQRARLEAEDAFSDPAAGAAPPGPSATR